jgi:flagellin-specific chaperone FliS
VDNDNGHQGYQISHSLPFSSGSISVVVYEKCIRTIQELKEKMTSECIIIKKEMLQRVQASHTSRFLRFMNTGSGPSDTAMLMVHTVLHEVKAWCA